MKTIRISLVSLVVMASGCAFTPQAIELQPKTHVVESSVGKGRAVFVNVVDERSRKTLGTRGAGIGSDLSLAGDLPSIIRTSISDGLTRQGFSTNAASVPDAAELRVEIRDLDYEVRSGFWAGSLRTECNLKGICQRKAVPQYQKLYNGKFESSIQVVQSDERNNEFVNLAVSRALDSLLGDDMLLKCLAAAD